MKRSVILTSLFFVSLTGALVGVWIGHKFQEPQVVYGPQPASATTGPALMLEPDVTLAPAQINPSLGFADVVDLSLPAVVSVTNTQQSERSGGLFEFFNRDDDDQDSPRNPMRGFGSGFIISKDGYILTNNHVVEDSRRLSVKLDDNRTFEAEVIGTDPSIDLALLKLDVDEDMEFPALRLGDSESLRVGEWVIAIGSPLNFENSVTVGVVSAKDRSVPLESADISLTKSASCVTPSSRMRSSSALPPASMCRL